MKGKILFLATAVMGMIAFTSCNETSSGDVSKPIGEQSATNASMTSDKTTDKATAKNTPSKDNTAKEKAQPTSSELLDKTSITFDAMEHDFGVIDEGDKVEHIFNFTNTGSEPLILEKCKGSCGCTVPECPKEPILPGDTGEIKDVFNSKGKKNKQTKKVTITANTEPIQTILTIKAQETPEVQ